jgi:hypothetical protein
MPQTFERNEVGKREDLADAIYLIDARMTPLLSAVPKGAGLVNTLFDWQMDAYDAPNTSGVVDGTDVSATEDAAVNRARTSGRVHKLRQTPKVSDFTDFTDVAGLGQGMEYAHAVVKKTVEIKRAAECVLGGDQDSQADNGTVPYITRGLGAWIQNGAQTDLPVPVAFRTPTASITTAALSAIDVSAINAIMQSQYQQTGKVQSYMWAVGPSLKKRITDLVGYQPTVANYTALLRTNVGDQGAWEHNIQSFTGDFGTYDIAIDNWLGYNNTTKVADARRGYVLDPQMLSLRMHKPWNTRELPDMGGGRRGLIEVVMGLQVKNPLGLAKFASTAD